MTRNICILALTLVVGGLAFAQDDYGSGNPASVTQEITVVIPQRVALHVPEDSYTLDLTTPGSGNFNLYKPGAPGDLQATGEGCVMMPKHWGDFITEHENGDGPGINPNAEMLVPSFIDPSVIAAYGMTGETEGDIYLILEMAAMSGTPIAAYPAVVTTTSGDVAVDGEDNFEKGSLVCFNQKVIQKFSNSANGFTLTATVDIDPGAGKFGIVERWMPGVTSWAEGGYRHLLDAGQVHQNRTLATSSTSTGGWLDENITELFWFDGSEVAGTHQIDVTYTLTGTF